MKKLLIATVVALVSLNTSQACEICGCGTGNYYLGFVPGFHHHFFGMRYQFSNFKTVLADNPTQFSNDYFKSIELWGGINISKKIQLIGILPVNFIHQVSDDGTINKNDLGDVAVILNYKLFDKTNTSGNNTVNHQVWIGTGIKLPTGKFDVDITIHC